MRDLQKNISRLATGGSLNAKLSCTRGEGAFLNVETGNALFTYCEESTKDHLKAYLKDNYESLQARLPRKKELFLVTGTYMTKNWENAVFRASSNSVASEISVDAGIVEGKFSVDWRSLKGELYAFQTGHLHPDQPMPDHNQSVSFGACCRCEQSTENQCIFLRGWRVKRTRTLLGTRKVVLVPVDGTESISFKEIESSAASSFPMENFLEDTHSPGPPQHRDTSYLEENILLEEAEGTPNDNDLVSRSSRQGTLSFNVYYLSPTYTTLLLHSSFR